HRACRSSAPSALIHVEVIRRGGSMPGLDRLTDRMFVGVHRRLPPPVVLRSVKGERVSRRRRSVQVSSGGTPGDTAAKPGSGWRPGLVGEGATPAYPSYLHP